MAINEDQETSTTSEYKNPNEKRVWYDYGNEYRLKERAVLLENLENAVYTISQDVFGFYLEKENDTFTFDSTLS